MAITSHNYQWYLLAGRSKRYQAWQQTSGETEKVGQKTCNLT